MNSTELVHHFPTGRRSSPAAEKRSAPRFCTELAGPVRGAILRARQLLLSEQRSDGLWSGRQSADASLASLLIFWLAFTEREHGELAQQCAARILELQLPEGGWSRSPDEALDVSTSVQTYFALKLLGIDPSSERLARARDVIRQHGGADAADATTRLLLALFGQISYDDCPAALPEASLFGSNSRQYGPMAIVWSHKSMQDVGIERGVRELFVRQPRDWPRPTYSPRRGRIAGFARLLGFAVAQRLERRDGTPPRRRALTRLKAELIRGVANDRIDELRFDELIWHMIALCSVGFDFESQEIQACDDRMLELVDVDENANTASPQYSSKLMEDSALVVRSLLESGMPINHDAVSSAMDSVYDAASSKVSAPTTAELCSLLNMAQPTIDSSDDDLGLPPGIEISRHWYNEDSLEPVRTENRSPIEPLFRETVKQLLALQNADGGWRECDLNRSHRRVSAPDVTGFALEALNSTDSQEASNARARAVEYLRVAQRADGSWMDEFAAMQVQATSWALRGLLSAGVSADDDAIAAGLNWLVVHQHSGGGWSGSTSADETRARDGASDKPTAAALVALVAAGRANHAAARRAVEFLVDAQDDEGRWRDSHFFDRDTVANHWFGNDLHSIAWPLLALSRWAVAAVSAQSAAASEMSLRLVGAAADE